MRSWILSAVLLGFLGYAPCGRAADDADLPADIIRVRDIPYRDGGSGKGSTSWKLDLAVRKGIPTRPRPGIVVIHGGGWLEGDKSSFASREHKVPGNIIDFAELGFVAVTINYRMSGEAPFPAALEDCKSAVRWLRAHAGDYHLDPARIGAYGNSAGGHLALLLGMVGKDANLEGDGPFRNESSLVQAAASDSGPLDLVDQYQGNRLREVVKRFLGGPPEAVRISLYQMASPIHRITPETPPLLLIYGAADEQVPIESADRFVSALGRAGLPDVSYHRLAYVGHCTHSLVGIPYLRTVVNEFFVRTLLHPESSQKIRRAGDSR